jgi:hypothetical protein
MKTIFTGLSIAAIAMVLGIGMIAPATAAPKDLLFQSCGPVIDSVADCTVIWDTNNNGICESSDTTLNMKVQEDFIPLLQERLDSC